VPFVSECITLPKEVPTLKLGLHRWDVPQLTAAVMLLDILWITSKKSRVATGVIRRSSSDRRDGKVLK
jgi:hypothetical protein